MQVFVKVQVFDSFSTEEDEYMKRIFGTQLQHILNSGKVLQSGIFADSLGGFFLLEVGSIDELSNLISPSMLHNMHVEVHAVMAVEKLTEVFEDAHPNYKN